MVGFSGRGKEERRPLESVEEMFESLLASRLRPEIQGKPSVHDSDIAIGKERGMLTGLPIRVFGDVFYVGDGVTAVVGDAEIPDGSIVDATLVVKGKLRVGAKCQIVKNLKALGGISIAEGCLVKANVASGDAVELGENTIVEGEVHAEVVRLSEGAEIHGRIDARRVQSVHRSTETPSPTLDALLRKAAELLGEEDG